MLALFVTFYPSQLWINFLLNFLSMLGSVAGVHFLPPWQDYPPAIKIDGRLKDYSSIQVAVI